MLQSDPSLPNIDIHIENCDFTWGSPPKSDEDIKKDNDKINKVKTLQKECDDDIINNTNSNTNTNSESNNTNNIDVNLHNNINEDDSEISNYDRIKENDKENSNTTRDSITDNKDNKLEKHELDYKINLKNINISIKKGELIGIIGKVAAGKSSLLQAIINNLIMLTPEEKKSKLILNGTVSYLSQTPWIQNETLRENILFFKGYNKDKYENILELCQLKQDVEILTGGDLTEIGEKGINLSGGQKARIALARAVHADSDIYLLDDPISALDANVGEKIMKECILKYLDCKTRILVTNAIQFLPFMDRIIFMEEGEIIFFGTYQDLKNQNFFIDFTKKVEDEHHKLEKTKSSENYDEESDIEIKEVGEETKTKVKKIIDEEDREEGFVKWDVYFKFFEYYGGMLGAILVLIGKLKIKNLILLSNNYLAWFKNFF